MRKLLVVVDYQNDFVDGALGFKGAEKLETGILHRVEETLRDGGYVLFTRDTHPKEYLETREGKFLPIPHCVEGETGHALYGALVHYQSKQVTNVALVDKPLFSVPQVAQAAQALCGGAPSEIELCGLVTDICVLANAILLHAYFPLAQIRVLENLVGTGNEAGGRAAVQVLRGMGIEVS